MAATVPDVPPFLASVRGAARRLDDGQALFRAGDPAAGLYRVESGLIRLTRRGVCVHAAGPGALFGESGLFAAGQPVDAVAAGPAAVVVYPKAALLLHLKAHPDLALAFAAWTAGRLDAARAGLQMVRLKGAADRVLAFLIQAGAADGVVALDRPLAAVAAELGLTHEALYRTLARLVAQGRVERPGRGRFRVRPASG
jgi:CRP-like cAMP-binding protein